MTISSEEEDRIFDAILLQEAIDELPPKYQIILALKASGYTQDECGTIMGLTRQAVGFIFKRAIKALRVIYKELLMEGDYVLS